MIKFTSALRVLTRSWKGAIDCHLTLSFCTPVHTSKMPTSNLLGVGYIRGVQYWEKPNVTVLLVSSKLVVDRHNAYKTAGYGYEGNLYTPHITVARGNHVEDFEYLLGSEITLGEEYFRLLDLDKCGVRK